MLSSVFLNHFKLKCRFERSFLFSEEISSQHLLIKKRAAKNIAHRLYPTTGEFPPLGWSRGRTKLLVEIIAMT